MCRRGVATRVDARVLGWVSVAALAATILWQAPHTSA